VRSITDTIEMESSFFWSYMDRHARSLTNFSLRYWPEDEVEESENSRARDNYFQLDGQQTLLVCLVLLNDAFMHRF
jgi:hypothetical protein